MLRAAIARWLCWFFAPVLSVATGRWHGEILGAPQGAGGFGYDPLMHIPALGRTVATSGSGSSTARTATSVLT